MQRGVQASRQVDDGASAVDVDGALFGRTGCHVVDRRAVHQMVDPAHLGDGLVGQRQLRQLPDQRLCAFAPLGGQAFEASQRLAPDQHPHLGVGPGVQQASYDAATNKPGTAGNDIPHSAMVAGIS